MKFYALSLAMLLQGSIAFAQTDPTVMTINGQPVSRSEFEYSFNKNNSEGVIDKKSVKEYVDLFVNYKLKVQAALDAHLDTLSSFKAEFLQYRDQQIRPFVISEKDVETEAHKIYNDTRQRVLAAGGMVKPAHILIRLGQKASAAEQDKAKYRADSLYQVLKKGGNFAELAKKYSDDKGSAVKGGDISWITKGQTVKAFEDACFSMKVGEMSKPVLSEFGYHIIQLVDKRGDKVKVRHILLKPKVSQDEIDKSLSQLDSISDDIRNGKFTFEDGATFISDDKDTRNNRGLMSNLTEDGATSRFQMKDLPTEVARVVDTMKVGEISKPFTLTKSNGKTSCAIVKLKSRVEGHRATITEDFQVMKHVVMAKMRQKALHDWVVDKIKHTYVRMNDRYKDCKYEYQGWVR